MSPTVNTVQVDQLGPPPKSHLGAEGAGGHLAHSGACARVNHAVAVPLQHGAAPRGARRGCRQGGQGWGSRGFRGVQGWDA